MRQSEEAEEDVEREEGEEEERVWTYSHTADNYWFVRQHLLCQHSSRQPRGAKNRLQSSELFRETDSDRQTETRPDTGRRNHAFSLDSVEFTFMLM